MSSDVAALHDYIDSLPVISTHEHHRPFPPDEPCTLEALFSHSYVGWSGVPLNGPEDRRAFLELMCGNSYFRWYERALASLFGIEEITTGNWDSVSEAAAATLALDVSHEVILRDHTKCRRAVLDAYWAPGSDNGLPDLYSPTLRVNSFVYGRTLQTSDHNGNNAQRLYGACSDLDEYVAMADRVIAEHKARGAVALKSALAYDRPLDFRPVDKRDAARVFNDPDAGPEADRLFGDYTYDQLCAAAARAALPFQNHVGLGRLGGSNPMNLQPMIERHPETRFVLFHMGYPWIEEVCALSHNYANVYPDLCWLPSIGATATVRALHSLIETGRDASRVCWGGDAWMVTETYAASLAMRHALKAALTEKMESGYLTPMRARMWAERILWRNAAELYGLAP
ncbi:MAG: amidohydrolase family protein [Armatimonadetes bacterium]|nr:amidohydrolase family protein [Armatimonadota bacterium]